MPVDSSIAKGLIAMLEQPTTRRVFAGAVVLILLIMIGCSKYLTVEFVNQSGKELTICSVSQAVAECKSVENGAAVRLIFHQGHFTVTNEGRDWRYHADVPEPFEKYVPNNGDPVRMVITEDLALYAVEHGMSFDSVTDSSQPVGYPVMPRT